MKTTLTFRKLVTLTMALGIFVSEATAATYYVATNGNDVSGDGSVGNPWATIGYADSQSLLIPGDTVMVAAGTYPQASGAGVVLQNNAGASGAPIAYLANGKVVIDQSGFSGQTYGFQVQSPYIIVSGFEIKGAAHGIVLDGSLIWTGNNCVVTNCLIHDSGPVDSSGVYLNKCDGAQVVRNVIYNISAGANSPWAPLGAGIRVQGGGINNVWNNTIDNAFLGVFVYGSSLGAPDLGHISTLNNIVVNAGGWAFVNPWSTDPSLFTSGYNLVYNDAVTYGNYPAGNNGPLPSDVTSNPRFVFPAIHNYLLLSNSPALDVGTNVGMAYQGSAPDLGAFEGANPPAAIGTIQGTVVANVAGNPALAGVSVQTTNGAFATITDANGNYQLVVPTGTNVLKASGAFLTTQVLSTNVDASGVVTLNFSLSLTNTPKTNYVDNATGNDANPGTQVQPWKTIGNGDATGALSPGDTVIVNAGTYVPATTNGVNLTNRFGYNFAPITYQAQGSVVVDQSGVSGSSYGFRVIVAAITLKGFEVKGAQHGVYLGPGSDFATVDSCVIHDANGTSQDASGIYVNQSSNLSLTRNIIYNINAVANTPWSPVGAGIRLQGGNNVNAFNNTIDNAYLGVFCYGGTGLGSGPGGLIKTENNIVVNCTGWGFVNPFGSDSSKFVSGYNLVYNDTTTFGNYPAGNNGPVGTDVAADPKFVNGAAHNYQLQNSSPALNMGLVVGLPYIGVAPDLGATESSYIPPLVTYYVDSATGNDANAGTQVQPWKTIANGATTGVLKPGDTVIVNAGNYVPASSAGADLRGGHGVPTALITYQANSNVVIDQSAASVPSYGVKLGAATKLQGFEIKGAEYGVYVLPGSDSAAVDSCVIHDANGTGSDASGIYVGPSANVRVTRNVIYNINAANTPWSPVGTGVEAQDANNLQVLNNTINNCYLGVFFYGGGGKGAGPYGHITTENNIVANCTGWGFVNPWSTDGTLFTCGYNLVFNDVTTFGNFPAGNNGPFPSDVTGNPLFVNAAGGDFHLQAGTPALNKGTNVGLPYAGSAPDMGAYDLLDPAPTVLFAWRDSVQQTVVTVVFRSALTASTATNVSNYALNHGNSISAASLNADGRTVVLTTSPLANNTTGNILTINNVKNIDGVNIVSNTQAAISVPNDTVRVQSNLGGSNDLIVLEAEDYNQIIPAGGVSWLFTTSPPFLLPTATDTNFSGTGCMYTPNNGFSVSYNPGDRPVGIPEMDYKVYFTTPGTYTIWVRGSGDSDNGGANDSVNLGLDGVLAYRINNQFPQAGGYVWGNTPTPAGSVLTVPTAGLHVFNIWVREDGFAVDKVIITRDFSYTPTGTGPAESAIVVVPTLAIVSSGGNVVLTWPGAGILQSSTNVVGPYSDIIGSSSPWTNAPTTGPNYYRVRQ